MKLSELKEGQRFVATAGKNRLEGIATMDFNANSGTKDGYVNVKLDGVHYEWPRQNTTIYYNESWNVRIQEAFIRELLPDLPIGTLFKVRLGRFTKVGPDQYIGIVSGETEYESLPVLTSADFGDSRESLLTIINKP